MSLLALAQEGHDVGGRDEDDTVNGMVGYSCCRSFFFFCRLRHLFDVKGGKGLRTVIYGVQHTGGFVDTIHGLVFFVQLDLLSFAVGPLDRTGCLARL